MRPLWPTGLCWDDSSDGPTQEARIHAWSQPQRELPGHVFRLSLVYIWALQKESEISPEARKQQLSFANTTEIFSRTIDSK